MALTSVNYSNKKMDLSWICNMRFC